MPSRKGTASGRGAEDNADNAAIRLGAQLRRLRIQAGRSLKDLESEVHVSDSSLSRYLAGQAVPPWSVVERLSKLAGREVGELHPLWEEANRSRRPSMPSTGAPDDTSAASTSAAETATSAVAESAPAQPATWRRRHPRVPLMTAFVATALVFGTGGVLIGRQFGVHTVALKPTEDAVCRDWPWPADEGQAVQPAVQPRASDHSPTIELIVGKATDGKLAAWARITNAAFGDRVWMDMSTDGARSWTQCGPFPATTSTGTSRAHDTGSDVLFRACGDVPTPAPNARGEMCTNW